MRGSQALDNNEWEDDRPARRLPWQKPAKVQVVDEKTPPPPLEIPEAPAILATKTPTLEEALPEFARLIEIRAKLYEERAASERKIQELRQALDAPADAGDDEDMERRLKELMDGARPARAAGGAELGNTVRQQLAAELDRRAEFDLQIKRISAKIGTVLGAASVAVCATVQPRYTALVRQMARALLAVNEAHAAYIALCDELTERGVFWTQLHPMHLTMLGQPNDQHGRLAAWLRDAAERGFIPQDDIPEGLRFV